MFSYSIFLEESPMAERKTVKEALIVEDDREIRRLLANFLMEKGMVITEAGDGDKAYIRAPLRNGLVRSDLIESWKDLCQQGCNIF